MIPFFRKIRKKMADDNRPLKYMRYAIGEIVLVIIGILLALQINNWNSERIEKKTFQSNLQFVIEDLEQDKIDLLELKNQRQHNINQCALVLQTVKEGKVLSPTEILNNSNVMIWKSFDINENGLERILSTDIYESIDFQPIRKIIRKYQISYQRIKGLEKKLNESVEEMEIEMSKEGSITELYAYANLRYFSNELDDASKNELENYSLEFNKLFTNNPPMLSLFQRSKLITTGIIFEYDSFIQIGEDLQIEIENFLNKI